MYKNKLSVKILILTTSVLPALFIGEVTIRAFTSKIHKKGPTSFSFKSKKLLAKPNSMKSAIKFRDDGSLVYKIEYVFDEFGRRKYKKKKGAENFAIFFGGSNTFGYGLPIHQTLPLFFSNNNPSYQTYTYARPAHGPSHMLAIINENNLSEQISSKHQSGNIYYFSSVFHIKRYLGTFSFIGRRGGRDPYFKLIGGKLVNMENFAKGRPISTFLYWALYKSYLAKILLEPVGDPYGVESQKLLCAIINDAAKKAYTNLNNRLKNFYFVSTPFNGTIKPEIYKPYYNGVKKCLSPKVKFFEVFPNYKLDWTPSNLVVDMKYDQHLSGTANYWLSKELPLH